MDIVLYGGRIHLVDRDFRTVEAILVRDSRVAAAGTDAEVSAVAEAGYTALDMKGGTAVPGLSDSHMHLCKEIREWGQVDLRGSRSVAEVLERMRMFAADKPVGSWVIASPYWHEIETNENRLPTRLELDDSIPDHPVMIPRGMYRCMVNSLALKLAGINRDTPDPRGGKIEHDEGGEPTGFLRRGAIQLVRRVVPPSTFEDHVEDIKRAMRHYNRLGLTSIRDPNVPPEQSRVYQALWERGEMTLRVNMLPRLDQSPAGEPLTSSELTVRRLRESPVRTGFGDAWLRVGSLKAAMDGGIEDAYLIEPYASDPEYHGFIRMGPDVLDDIMTTVAAGRWGLAMHVSGDAAMTQYLAAVERVSRRFDLRPLRWAIEHAFLCTPEQCRFIRDHGIFVTLQPALIYDFGDAFVYRWGEERARKMIAVRDMLDAGLEPGGGSDGPYVNPCPLLGMQVAMTRQTARAGKFSEDQAIEARTALTMYTLNNARITGEECDKGSLEVGKLADMVVLSEDPLTCPAEQVSGIEVLMTMVDGQIVHREGI